ncbi:hypothetical protein [Microseira sp. BLCC-F43]|jgi:hypothetical protein
MTPLLNRVSVRSALRMRSGIREARIRQEGHKEEEMVLSGNS